MKNILLLTDFSENSLNAIRYALRFFADELCNFHVLYVQKSTTYLADDFMHAAHKSIYDTIIKKPKIKLAKLVVLIENEFNNKNHNFTFSVNYNTLVRSVKGIKKAKKTDLIVMGTNGVTGANEVLFGSNTINIINKIDCPTLVIPEGFTYQKRPKEVLLPLDLRNSINGDAFLDILKFVHHFNKTLHLLRIKPNNETSKEEQKDKENIAYFLEEINHQYHIISNTPIPEVISCYIQTHKIDLVALMVKKETFFERFFKGSATAKIVHKVPLPILIFHS